ncbi:unnamed protein product [Rotaria socialis]
MIFSSIILCGFFPMVIRLIIARRRYIRYIDEFTNIAYSTPDAFINLESLFHSVKLNIDEPMNSHEHSLLYPSIPFIDELTKDEETVV